MFGVPDDASVAKEPSLEEINAKVPRTLRLSYDGRSSLWIMLVSLGVGLIWLGGLSWYLIHQSRLHDALARKGHEAPAQVTRMLSQKHGYAVYYTFQVAGTDYQNEASSTNAPIYPSVGSHITVLYLPSDPSENYPKGWGWFDIAYIFLFYFGSLPVCIGVYAAWNLFRDHSLARHGWVTEGKVTLCVPKKNTGKFMVDYEFRTQNDFRTQKDDELIEGSNNDCQDEYKADSKIKVIYLRNRPKRNNSYPLDSYQMVEHKAPDDPFMTER